MEDKIKLDVLQTLGKNVKQFRLSKGLSQENLACELQKSVNFISLLENGKTGLSVQTIIDICKVLYVDANSLFTGIIDPIEAKLDTYITNSLSLFDDKDKAIVADLITYILNSKK